MNNRVNQSNISVVWMIGLYLLTAAIVYLGLTTDYQPIESLTPVRMTVLLILFPVIIKYLVQLFLLPLYSWRVRLLRKNKTDYRPKVSVLIPAYNEQVGILKTIRSVLDTGYPHLELIVVNDGSTDNTHQIVTEFCRRRAQSTEKSVTIKYFRLTNGGKARALNYGITKAKGEIVVTIDADSVMDPKAIEKLLIHFQEPQVAAVAGNVIVGNRHRSIEVLQQLEYLYGFFFKRADSVFNSVYIIGGAAAAYRLDILKKLGGFDHQIITEDIEMSTRILAHGYKTRYANDAIVYTEGPSEFKGLCNQRLRWKFGRLLTFIKHRSLFFSVNKAPSNYLTWLILPLAVYAELTLLLEPLLLSVFYGYTIITNDYLPLLFVIGFMTTLLATQISVDPCRNFHRNLYWLAPVAWIAFYVIDWVEYQALVRSLKRLWTRQELHWQKWVRVGVMNHKVNLH